MRPCCVFNLADLGLRDLVMSIFVLHDCKALQSTETWEM